MAAHNEGNNSKIIVMLVLWMIFSYAILWFFGGACTDIFHGGTCLSSDSIQGLRSVPLVGLILPYNAWVSIMYFIAPLAGFVLAYFAIRWFNEYFETNEASSLLFIPLIIVVLILGYYINLSWYYGEMATLSTNSQVKVGLNPFLCFFEPDSTRCAETVNKTNSELITQAQNSGAQVITQYIKIDYWAELRESIYLTFILGAIAAWAFLFFQPKISSLAGAMGNGNEGHNHSHRHEEHKRSFEHKEHAHHEQPKHEVPVEHHKLTPEEKEISLMAKEVALEEKEMNKKE